jgi:hypothetical protein
MSCNQRLANGLALILILLGVGVGLAQEKPVKPQDGPRTSMIDELWRQMGQLQRQIVGLEVGDASPRATLRSEPAPRNSAELYSDIPQKKAAAESRDDQNSEPVQKTVPGQEAPPKLRDSSNEAQIDQLWRQITELQKTILKLEITDTNPRLFATATLSRNDNDRIERSDNIPKGNSNRPSRDSPKGDPLQKSPPAPQKPLQPRGGSNEAEIGHLWQQIGKLYKQIVAMEVGDNRPH